MERRLHFYSGPGLKLDAILEVPDGVTGKRPCVVLCHGPSGGKQFVVPDASKWLARAGYVTLRFDHRGFGDSEGPRNRLIPMEQVEDIRNAITFAQQQAEVEPGRIGLFGGATGGANAIYSAAMDNRVGAVAAVSPAGDCGRWVRSMRRYWEWVETLKRVEADRVYRVLNGPSPEVDIREIIMHDPASAENAVRLEREGRLTAKRYLTLEGAEAIIAFRPEEVVDRISPRAVMWVVAGADTLVPVAESEGMYARAGEPKKLLRMEGAKHHDLYKGAAFDRMMGEITAWYDSHLRG